MGCRQGGLADEENAAVSDVLLFTTMCIVGLPVDVHVKDGSVYSGIFHTACVDDNYAIVLKKAMMVKKGNRKANVTSGNVIETLVILSEDLAQVVAKGITLPADGIPGYVKGDDGGAMVDDIRSPETVERRTNLSKSNESSMDTLLLNSKRGTQESMKAVLTENGESTVFQQEQNLQGDQGSNPQCEPVGNVCSESPIVTSVKHDQNINEQQSIENNRSSASVPKDGASVSDVSSNVCPSSPCVQTDLVPPRSSVCNKAAKSKLNPGAKIFRPSISHHHRAVNPPPVQTTAYVPDSSPVVHLATVEPEVEISPYAPRSSVPIKLSQCNNMVAGNGNIDLQYVQPAMGYMGSRTAPTRYASQYHQLQAGTGYMHPNSENVMVGRLGPVVYVHPVSHGVVQSASGFSQVSSCLLNPLQAHLTKHQGNVATQTLPLRMTPPPFIAGAQQTYAIPSQVPISHPSFPVMRPVQVPCSNPYFSPKYA